MEKLNVVTLGSVLIIGTFLPVAGAYADMSSDLSRALAQNQQNNSKLQGGLQQLLPSPQAQANPTVRSLNQVLPSLQLAAPAVSDGYVVIDAVADNNTQQLKKELVALGMKGASSFGRIVSGRFPVDKLAKLDNVTVLRFARHSLAIKDKGAVTSQGDVAMRSDTARQTYGVTGAGIKVGVLSDSYDCLKGAAAGKATGDLPENITVLEEGDCANSGTDEGRGMMEIVHDVAPGASLLFNTAVSGQAGFANGIINLADAGADVIVDDVLYPVVPFFQDGIIAQAVDQVNREQDVSYFSSAGNNARDSYESHYREFGDSLFANFAAPGQTDDICLEIEIGAGRSVTPVLQWDQPFFSVSGGSGATTDLDMFMFQSCDFNLQIAPNNVDNVGSDPIEINGVFNPTSGPLTLGIVIQRRTGPVPGRIKLVTNGGSVIDINRTQSSTSYGHKVARGAMGVGASFFLQAPPSVSPAEINTYSSAGGTRILFDTKGKRLRKPDIRKQPAIVGPDGINTSFFGSVFDGFDFPFFFGTSASAPHVAAVAALMREHNPYANTSEIYDALTQTAEDMDDPLTGAFDIGYDTGTGYGFINAEAALSTISPPAEWYCDGELATIIGTKKSERLVGTPGDDIIVGLKGNDQIDGKGGNDIICGGKGNDTIWSGDGDDSVFGGQGKDVIFAGNGDDEVHGDDGKDTLFGDNGNDKLYGGKGKDELFGKQGDDLIDGGKGADKAFGGPGQDTCDAEFVTQCH